MTSGFVSVPGCSDTFSNRILGQNGRIRSSKCENSLGFSLYPRKSSFPSPEFRLLKCAFPLLSMATNLNSAASVVELKGRVQMAIPSSDGPALRISTFHAEPTETHLFPLIPMVSLLSQTSMNSTLRSRPELPVWRMRHRQRARKRKSGQTARARRPALAKRTSLSSTIPVVLRSSHSWRHRAGEF